MSSYPAFATPATPPAPARVAFEIPLIPGISSSRQISLAGVPWLLTVTWCDPAQIWTLEIDDIDGNRVLSGVPLVTGSDLLAQFPHLNFGGALVAQTDNDYQAPPTLLNLGLAGHLYFLTAAAS